MREFGTFSGVELNMDKCDFMWLGRQRSSEQPICDYSPVKLTKILGIYLSATQNCSSFNANAVWSKIKSTLEQWSQRDLSIKGKITVAKSMVVSQLVYLMAATQIEKTNSSWYWEKRYQVLVAWSIMDVKKGGLRAPELAFMYRANRMAWIGRMSNTETARQCVWKNTAEETAS